MRPPVTQPRVVTVTLSPALDDSFTVPRLTPSRKLRCGALRIDPGGGGINVARVLQVLGEPALAIFPLNGHIGDALLQRLEAEQLRTATLRAGGETRQSHHVTDLETGLEYRFVLPGPPLSQADQSRLLGKVSEHAEGAAFVVLSGSLPSGVTPVFVSRLAEAVDRAGAQLVVDVSGDALREVRGAYLLKPSVSELSTLVGRHLESEGEQLAAADEARVKTGATLVALSRGNQGLLLVGDQISLRVDAHAVAAVSTVGAGDALVAGLVFALARGWPPDRAARLGVACSAAMVQTAGTSMFTRRQLAQFTDEVLGDDPA